MNKTVLALAGAVAIGAFGWGGSWIGTARAMPVYDSANYAQNLIQAARSLEQINHQLASLQNEAAMLTNMGKNLKTLNFKELDALTAKLQEVDKLMGRAEGIGFKVNELEREYQGLFASRGGTQKTGGVVADARNRIDAAMAAFKQSMGVQAQVIENVAEDAAALQAIAGKSQGAEGSLQAQQATNQLLALAAKQQMQLQSLMAAQFRSENVEAARRLRSEEEARSATRRFLGNGKAYRIPK